MSKASLTICPHCGGSMRVKLNVPRDDSMVGKTLVRCQDVQNCSRPFGVELTLQQATLRAYDPEDMRDPTRATSGCLEKKDD